MASVCYVDKTNRLHRLAWFALALSVVVTLSIALNIWQFVESKKTKQVFHVTMAPSQLEFEWKCRLCGANNKFKEEVGK